MSEIPMQYRSAYRWCGEGASGECTIEGAPLMAVGTPHEPQRYSPEHLLVVAAETCLANYVLLIAQKSKLPLRAYGSSAEGELMQEERVGFRFRRIVIRAELTVEEGAGAAAQRVLDKAHRLCLIARSLNCEVAVEGQIHEVPAHS